MIHEIGAEKYMRELYSHGEISLREAAAVLDMPARDVLELFWDMGISGNVGAEETLRAISVAEKISKYK